MGPDSRGSALQTNNRRSQSLKLRNSRACRDLKFGFWLAGRIDSPMNANTFFAELRRRRVYSVAIAYVVGGWALAQGIAQVLPVFDTPNWVVRLLVVVIVLGFPVALT